MEKISWHFPYFLYLLESEILKLSFRRARSVSSVPSVAPPRPCRVRHLRKESSSRCHHLRFVSGWPKRFPQEALGCLKTKFWVYHQKQSQPCDRLWNHGQYEGIRGERHSDWHSHRNIHEAPPQSYQKKRSGHRTGIQECSEWFPEADRGLHLGADDARVPQLTRPGNVSRS